jgi:hypothetical protein
MSQKNRRPRRLPEDRIRWSPMMNVSNADSGHFGVDAKANSLLICPLCKRTNLVSKARLDAVVIQAQTE